MHGATVKMLYYCTLWKLQAEKCVTEWNLERKIRLDGRDIKLVPCTIPDLFVFYAYRVMIKFSRVLTKKRTVFVQQSHLNAMK
jgi:hypothetical protein